jgi:hypothetical protein
MAMIAGIEKCTDKQVRERERVAVVFIGVLALKFSVLFRLAEHACAHIHTQITYKEVGTMVHLFTGVF